MAEPQLAPQTHRLPLTVQDVERRKRIVGLGPDDLARIASIKSTVTEGADQFGTVFFDYLRSLDGTASLFKNTAALDEARRLKREHILAMVGGDYGVSYVKQRVLLGALYSKVGLDVLVFLGAFHHLMKVIGSEVMRRHAAADPMNVFESFMSFKKVAFFDIGIIVDVLIDERERTISLQQEAIREISTPALQLRDRLLVMPIIGLIDTQRAKQLTDSMLHAIRANRAKVVVMDITGVAAVDSKVANHLLQTIAAARLMGATAIVTGLSAEVAQSLVALGVDLSRVNTVGDLQGGLEAAERLLGYKVVQLEQAASPIDAV
ncbi:MAG TPA: protoglobin domain-containing protein [Dongiaceae bacterium]|nr:protoglobin domain-containing protein [Dongiaceae bacterium]